MVAGRELTGDIQGFVFAHWMLLADDYISSENEVRCESCSSKNRFGKDNRVREINRCFA